jgi:hypothetical protein
VLAGKIGRKVYWQCTFALNLNLYATDKVYAVVQVLRIGADSDLAAVTLIFVINGSTIREQEFRFPA